MLWTDISVLFRCSFLLDVNLEASNLELNRGASLKTFSQMVDMTFLEKVILVMPAGPLKYYKCKNNNNYTN